MPPTGSNFMDWQQEERESLLFVDSDFSWSEPPPKRRRITEAPARSRRAPAEQPIRAERPAAVLEYEPEYDEHEPALRAYRPAQAVAEEHWDQPTSSHSHFDEMMEEWNANFGTGREFDADADRAFDLSDPGAAPASQGTRRTVVITGHGDERYLPAPRARRSSELRFHERANFSPDRFGLWAVLLAIALVFVAVAH